MGWGVWWWRKKKKNPHKWQTRHHKAPLDCKIVHFSSLQPFQELDVPPLLTQPPGLKSPMPSCQGQAAAKASLEELLVDTNSPCKCQLCHGCALLKLQGSFRKLLLVTWKCLTDCQSWGWVMSSLQPLLLFYLVLGTKKQDQKKPNSASFISLGSFKNNHILSSRNNSV